jgi:hypothetical protein
VVEIVSPDSGASKLQGFEIARNVEMRNTPGDIRIIGIATTTIPRMEA